MEESRREGRVPVALRVRFKSHDLADFVERYSCDLSSRGIFIRTAKPLASGTPLQFEFKLRDDQPLFRGEGTVRWIRAADPARPNLPPGMGVEFGQLPSQSQDILHEILSSRGYTQPLPQRAESVSESESASATASATALEPQVASSPKRSTPFPKSGPVQIAGQAALVPPSEPIQPWLIIVVIVVLLAVGITLWLM